MKFIIVIFCVTTMLACNNNAVMPKKENATIVSDSTRKEVYVCPMHPKVISDKAETCPDCGMDLEKVE